MAFTEQEVAEALGVGGKMQGIADPANDPNANTMTDPAGAAEPNGTDGEPANDGVQTRTEPQTEPTTGVVDDDQADDGADDGKQPLTPQQRKENAARRRQQEQQAAIDAAVAAALAQEKSKTDTALEGFFQRANIVNTVTGEPVTNLEQFLAWEEAVRKDKLDSGLKSGQMTAELLDEAISQHPVVKQAQALIDKSASDAQVAQQKAMEARIQTEMEKIGKLDPAIKTVADLKSMPNYQQFYALVGNNYSLLDAFRIVNFERLTNAAAEAGRQQAASNARSKDHLQATGNSRGAGAAAVPKDELAMYRLMNPGATDAQIQAHYNKYKEK